VFSETIQDTKFKFTPIAEFMNTSKYSKDKIKKTKKQTNKFKKKTTLGHGTA
jgi:hypothetical protein